MPGETKRKYIGESIRINKSLKRPLKSIREILPFNYDSETIIALFKKFYPSIWDNLEERYNVYKAKDGLLVNYKKKARYKPIRTKDYILRLPQVKLWLSQGAKARHQKDFNKEALAKAFTLLNEKRILAINRRNEVISRNTETIQNIEPLYIDVFISSYHQKGISIDGKIEIFNELKKFNNKKTIDFFYKLNDAEKNTQIRSMAFNHLQSLGKYVKLRKNFKGEVKSYMIEKSLFNMTPLDLLKRIDDDTLQSIKKFDFFISHSTKNRDIVLEVLKLLNRNNYTVYCDWTSDNDFLKRALVSDFTKVVLKKRLEQSENFVLLSSEDSLKSQWVEFELDYYINLQKPIYYIELDYTEDIRLKDFKKLTLRDIGSI